MFGSISLEQSNKEGFDNIETNTYAYPVYYGSGETPNLNIEFIDIDPPDITENYDNYYFHDLYDRSTNDPAWLYIINQRKKRVPSNTYPTPPPIGTYLDMAIYGVGEGVKFDIDFSDYPESGYESGSKIIGKITLNCAQFGIGTTSSAEFIIEEEAKKARFPVHVERIKNGTTVYEETLYVCTPSALYEEQGYNGNPNSYNFSIDQNGSIMGTGLNFRSLANLRPVTPVEFYFEVVVAPYTSKSDLFSMVLNSMIGQQSSCQVKSNNPSAYNYKRNPSTGEYILPLYVIDDIYEGITFYFDSDTYIHSNVGMEVTNDNYGISCVAVNNNYNNGSSIFLYFDGSLQFEIESGYVSQDSNKLTFTVKLDGVNLTASNALISGNMYNLPSPFKTNTENANQSVVGLSNNNQEDYIKASILEDVTNGWGWQLQDRIEGERSVRTCWGGFTSFGEIYIVPEASDKSSSFKTGGLHDVAAVYFDHRMRACGVQRLSNQVSVSHFGMFDRYNNNGRTEIDLRLMHTPPYWAKYWAPVYSKNLTYEKFLQVTVAEAFIGNETVYADILSPSGGDRPIIQALDGSDKGTIFLSLRGLEGKNESYKEFKGAELKYSFTPGDKIRIMEYKTETGYTVAPHYEFVVTGYHYFQDDDKNPIKVVQTSSNLDENNYRRTGWFLAIRDEDISGFNQEAVAAGTDLFSQKCLIEIFSPKKNTDKVPYFEIGSVYPVVDTPFGRTHGGDRDNISIPDFLITITGSHSFTSSQRLYIGDKVLTSGQNADGYVFVNGVLPIGAGTYNYSTNTTPSQAFTNFNVPAIANVQDSTSAGLFAGVVTLTKGDVYLRLREQLVNPESNDYIQAGQTFKFNKTKPDLQEYDTFLIESDTVSDFFDSKATSIGRPHCCPSIRHTCPSR